jgi:hypothetical protein
MSHSENSNEGARFARGCLLGLPPSLILWLAIIVIAKLICDRLAFG